MAKFVSVNTDKKFGSPNRNNILLNVDQIIYIGNDHGEKEIVHLADESTLWLERSEINKILRAASASEGDLTNIPDLRGQ